MSLPLHCSWEDLRALRRREIELADYLLNYGNLDETLDDSGSDERLLWEDYRDAWIDMPTSSRAGCRLRDLELPVRPLYAGGTGFTPPDPDCDPFAVAQEDPSVSDAPAAALEPVANDLDDAPWQRQTLQRALGEVA